MLVESLPSRRLMAFADVDASFRGPEIDVYSPALYDRQADGKFLLGVDGGIQTPARLLRLKADGSPDTAFGGGDGAIEFPNVEDPTRIIYNRLIDAAPTVGGKILVVYQYARTTRDNGVVTSNFDGVAVARFNADGTPDPSYGTQGVIGIRKRGAVSSISAATAAADGSIYLVSQSFDDSNFLNVNGSQQSAILKLTADGEFDAGWGERGILLMPARQQAGARDAYVTSIESMVVSDAHSVLIAGSEQHYVREPESDDQSADRFVGGRVTKTVSFVSRLNADGTLDARFGNAGSVRLGKASPLDARAEQLLRQPSGQLVLLDRYGGRVRALSLSASGRLLTQANIAALRGVAPDPFQIRPEPYELHGLPDGRIMIAERSSIPSERRLIEFRRRADFQWEAQPPRAAADVGREALKIVSSPLFVDDDGIYVIRNNSTLLRLQLGDPDAARADNTPNVADFQVTTQRRPESIDDLQLIYRDTRGGLKYRTRDSAGRWSDIVTIDASPGAGYNLSSIGSAVAYTEAQSADLKFAFRNADGSWTIETVDSAGATGYYPSLVPANGYAIAYYNRTNGDLRLARRGANGKWTIETVDRAGDVGRIPKLTERLEGRLAIAYVGRGTREVRLAEERNGAGGGWSISTLATIAAGASKVDVAFQQYPENDFLSPQGDLPVVVTYADVASSTVQILARSRSIKPFTLLTSGRASLVGQSPFTSRAFETVYYDSRRAQAFVTEVDFPNGVPRLTSEPIARVAATTPTVSPARRIDAGPEVSAARADDYSLTTFAWIGDNNTLVVREAI